MTRSEHIPVVFLNAFPVSRIQWEPLVARLADSSAGDRDIVTFDMPGLGDMPMTNASPSLDLIADAAVAAMREATGHEAAHWVGCSMGGYVAMAVAQRHPEAIAGLGLMATRSTADSDEARRRRLDLAEAMESEVHPPDPQAMAAPLVGRTDDEGTAIREAVASDIAKHSGQAIAWGQRAMAVRPDRTEVLRSLDVPAVVMVGDLDTITTEHDAALVADALETVPVVLSGVGHLCAWEDPDAVARGLMPLWEVGAR